MKVLELVQRLTLNVPAPVKFEKLKISFKIRSFVLTLVKKKKMKKSNFFLIIRNLFCALFPVLN